ncbi:MAG: DUF6599 family protein [Dysgonomonas sp.]
MIKYCINYIFLLLLLPIVVFAQDAEVKRERKFNASGLYGFMNGGTDQFLEYGVKELVVRDISYKSDDYTVEVYEMASPKDAYGIYSIHAFKCTRADTLNCIDCLSPYQLQAVSGNKYISVVFPSGSNVARKKADEVARMYVSMKNDLVFPTILEMEIPVSGKLKFLRGPLSISTASLSLSNLVKGIDYTGIWFVGNRLTRSYQALIYLPDNSNIEKIAERLSSVDILDRGENYIYISGTEKEGTEEEFGPFGF